MGKEKFDITSHFKLLLAAREHDNEIIIDANKMARQLYMRSDLSAMTREELEQRFIGIYVRGLLWQSGYRSIFKRYGYYINEKTLRPEMIARLFNNQKKSRDQVEKVLTSIKKHIRKNADVLDGQMEFDFDNGTYIESVSKDELLRMIEEEAV